MRAGGPGAAPKLWTGVDTGPAPSRFLAYHPWPGGLFRPPWWSIRAGLVVYRLVVGVATSGAGELTSAALPGA